MDSLEKDYIKNQKLYREIFLKAQESINQKISDIKKLFLCNNCLDVCEYKKQSPSLFIKYPDKCTYTKWQKECFNKLKNEISKDVYEKIQETILYKNNFSCARCAMCCKFACSEFSPEELKIKAQNNDKFAKEFTSIFIPYENRNEAAKIYPEYLELLKAKYGDAEEIYFYHCPKLSKDELCTDYENRPSICKDFPNNALAILPKECGFNKWKDDVGILSLTLHALCEIIDFYCEKLKKL